MNNKTNNHKKWFCFILFEIYRIYTSWL